MKQFSFLVFLLLGPLPAFALDFINPPEGYIKQRLTAGDVHEICWEMTEGQERSYLFESTTVLDFNIHYHVGDDVFYPVRRDGIKSDEGRFIATSKQEYCWMWENKEDYPIYLVYKIDEP